jgi:hypothetical protein
MMGRTGGMLFFINILAGVHIDNHTKECSEQCD